LTFQNLITSSPVAKGMTDEVRWQSDLNWRQEVVHKHTYIHIRTVCIYQRRRKHNLPSPTTKSDATRWHIMLTMWHFVT